LWQNFILAKKIIKEKYLVYCIIILTFLFNIFSLTYFALIDWDEGVFALQGQWLASIGTQGKPFNFQTPPLYQTLIAILFRLFQTNAIMLPILSIIFSCITIYLLFNLTKELYSPQVGLYSVIFFVVTEFFIFFSKSGLSDATFVCFFTASFLFFIRGVKFNKANHFFLAGFFAVLALYTKYSAFPLLIAFVITGLLQRGRINRKWFLLSIILPLLCYVPYLYVFLRFVQIPEISARHVSLLGLNHIKFLLYTLIFAPIPLTFSIIHLIVNIKHYERWSIYLYILVVTFYLILGFYYPFFRLVYPLIPFLSIISARFIHQIGRHKAYVLTTSVLISLVLGAKTITYKSDTPLKIGQLIDYYCQKETIGYVYTIVPPNINFYVKGTIAVPANHQWFNVGKKLPILLKGRNVIHQDNNVLGVEEKVLLLHATIFDSVKQRYLGLYTRGKLLDTLEFKDAPVYNEDIYNPHRNFKQIYEIYLFDIKELNESIDALWNLGFEREVTLVIR